jgi:hypothetical protein
MAEEESSSSSRIAEMASTNVARSQVTDSGAPAPPNCEAAEISSPWGCFVKVIIPNWKGDSMVDTTRTSASNEAVSALSEAGAPEIELTPAMIEAGVAVLYVSCAIEHPLDGADRKLVQRVFCAMLASMPCK